MDSNGYSIDIVHELMDLFQKEDVICFFEFFRELEGTNAITGFCKISRSKKAPGQFNYVSLVFIFDVPDEHVRAGVEELIKGFSEQRLRSLLSGVRTVLPMAPATHAPEVHLEQVDIIFDEAVDPDSCFIAEKLYPAIESTARLKIKETLWWDERPVCKSAVPPLENRERPGRGFWERLKNLLRAP